MDYTDSDEYNNTVRNAAMNTSMGVASNTIGGGMYGSYQQAVKNNHVRTSMENMGMGAAPSPRAALAANATVAFQITKANNGYVIAAHSPVLGAVSDLRVVPEEGDLVGTIAAALAARALG